MATGPLGAQQRPVARKERADSTARHAVGVTPKGAFIRSLILPGWGHASIGAWGRGAFYFAAETSTAWALISTRERLLAARDRVHFREVVIRQDLAAQGITARDSIRAHFSADPRLRNLRALVTTRASQQQDWLALQVFLVFLGGADAYVSAHLAHFPKPITVKATPAATPGRMDLTVSVPVPYH